MNEILQKIILGIIQGLTEFLPVSSSGHLEIVKVLIGDDYLSEASLLTTVVLHFGTAVATIVVFWQDIQELIIDLFIKKSKESIRFCTAILVSMIPAVIVGIVFESQINSMFTGQLMLVGICLLITGGLLLLADKAKTTDRDVSVGRGFWIGVAQMIAILPGISRSGATISTSVLLGIDREKAARFSFLMVVPLIFGKIAKDVMTSDVALSNTSWSALGAGFLAAFLVGMWACNWMVGIVKRSKLYYFTIYCVLAGLLAIAMHFTI